MRLRAQISLEFDVASFTDAGLHQRALERLLAGVRKRYPEAMLQITQRRERLDFGLERAQPEAAEPLDAMPARRAG